CEPLIPATEPVARHLIKLLGVPRSSPATYPRPRHTNEGRRCRLASPAGDGASLARVTQPRPPAAGIVLGDSELQRRMVRSSRSPGPVEVLVTGAAEMTHTSPRGDQG